MCARALRIVSRDKISCALKILLLLLFYYYYYLRIAVTFRHHSCYSDSKNVYL